jgi:replicative DNA helicase
VIDRVPPSNIEAEKAVVGIMLQYSDKIAVVMDKLRSEHFYKSDNRRIYDVITKLFMSNKPVDTISVKSELKDLDSSNINSYFVECMESVPSGESVEHYCDLILEAYRKREIIVCGLNLIKGAQEGRQSEEIIDEFSDKVISIQSGKKDVDLSDKIHELNDSIDKKQSNDYLVGIPSGLYDLDRLTCGWMTRDLIVLAARPSKGKTSLAINCIREALLLGKRVGFFSLEMSDSQIVARIMAQQAEVNVMSLLNGTIKFNQSQFEKYTKSQATVSSYIKRLAFDEYSRNITSIRAKAMSWKMKQGLDLVVIDFLQLFDLGKGGTVSDQLEQITAQLKAVAKDLDVPILLLSQLNSVRSRRS